MSQVLRHYLSNLTCRLKNLLLSHEEVIPTKEIPRLSLVLVKDERLHCLDQLLYVHHSMLLRFHASQAKICHVKLRVRVSEEMAAHNGVGLARLPVRVWQISAL